MRLSFKPWRLRFARWNEGNVRSFLRDVGDETEKTLRSRIMSPPKTGRRYGAHQASAPGEYPANETGELQQSIRQRIASRDATVGTTVMHGFWLREGTTRMAARKMSDAALLEALPSVRARMKAWAEWAKPKK